MNALLDLAERCEAAEGADRELDGLIGFELDLVEPKTGQSCRELVAGSPLNTPEDLGTFGDLPRFTASLDSAMTLVPEHAFWSITMRGEKRGGFHACCQLDGPLDWREAATPALAICAAALRAKASPTMGEG